MRAYCNTAVTIEAYRKTYDGERYKTLINVSGLFRDKKLDSAYKNLQIRLLLEDLYGGSPIELGPIPPLEVARQVMKSIPGCRQVFVTADTESVMLKKGWI